MTAAIPFTAYGVAGAVDADLTHEAAVRCGYAYVNATGAKSLVIGHDTREGSDKLALGIIAGANLAGCEVDAMPFPCLTEELVFTQCVESYDGAIMVTGEGAPAGHSGFVFFEAEGQQMWQQTFNTLKAIAEKHTMGPGKVGSPFVPVAEGAERFAAFLSNIAKGFGDWPPEQKLFTVVVDGGLSDAGHTFTRVLELVGMPKNVTVFPAHAVTRTLPFGHDPNHPLRVAAMDDAMADADADLGIAWSGDGSQIAVYGKDRVAIHPAYVGAYIAAAMTQRWPDQPIMCDHRVMFPMLNTCMSANAPLGAVLPGRAHMLEAMMGGNACYGAEASGRHYFREFFWNQSGILAAVLVTHMAYLTPKPIHEVLHSFKELYPICGEHHVKVPSAYDALNEVYDALSGESGMKVTRTGGEVVARLQRAPDVDCRVVVRPSRSRANVIGITVEGRGDADMPLLSGIGLALRDAVTGVPV